MLVHIWGDLALFSMVDMPMNRTSYAAPPYSAVRGMIESIIWKRGMNWQVTRGWVLSPVRYIQIMRNERETPSHRTQRRSLFLTQVSYVFDVEPVLNKDAKHPPAVYLTMLETALKTGRQFKPLFLGMRECLGNFGPPPPEWRTLAAQSNPQGVSLGTMPYHVQYTPEGPGRTVFANYTYDSNTGMYVPKERPSC